MIDKEEVYDAQFKMMKLYTKQHRKFFEIAYKEKKYYVIELRCNKLLLQEKWYVTIVAFYIEKEIPYFSVLEIETKEEYAEFLELIREIDSAYRNWMNG